MTFPESSTSTKHVTPSQQLPSDHPFHELMAGSNQQHERIREYAKMGAAWLNASFSAQRDESLFQQFELHPRASATPSETTEMIDVNLTLAPPTTTTCPSKATYTTPIMATTPIESEDWEVELLQVMRKAKEAQKTTATRNRELVEVNQSLITENQRLAQEMEEAKVKMEAMQQQLQNIQQELQKEQAEHELTQKALKLSRRTNHRMYEVCDEVMQNRLSIPTFSRQTEGTSRLQSSDHYQLMLQEKLRLEREKSQRMEHG
ncbi:hypothetical protein GOP47_0019370 [Adiantum capillus-veneris]|uniref:Uncharacterized protein n=1 Tax=Adiantum capillus-veneris TaxID=13818 RepID=A0A9D4Z8E3_ADICA|nr:hypothetical protein GOP47_0019370 [Adiantum capillus-veneris]